MTTTHSSHALLRKKLGKDAKAVLTTLNKKMKAGAPPAEVERAVAAKLADMLDKQVVRVQNGTHRMVNP